MHTALKLLSIAFSLLFIAGCNAQPADEVTIKYDSTTYKPGKHHFKFTDHGMFYNNIPFRLGDSIQEYVKIFGKYSRADEGTYPGGYIWDSLGMVLKISAKDRPHVGEIAFYVTFPEGYEDWDTNSTEYKFHPRCLIPDPLEIEKCHILIPSNMRFKKLLQSTDCFYQAVINTGYQTPASSSPEDYFHDVYYYIDVDMHDMAEKKTPYSVVAQFSVTSFDQPKEN